MRYKCVHPSKKRSQGLPSFWKTKVKANRLALYIFNGFSNKVMDDSHREGMYSSKQTRLIFLRIWPLLLNRAQMTLFLSDSTAQINAMKASTRKLYYRFHEI